MIHHPNLAVDLEGLPLRWMRPKKETGQRWDRFLCAVAGLDARGGKNECVVLAQLFASVSLVQYVFLLREQGNTGEASGWRILEIANSGLGLSCNRRRTRFAVIDAYTDPRDCR